MKYYSIILIWKAVETKNLFKQKADWQSQLRNLWWFVFDGNLCILLVNDDAYWTQLRDMIYRIFITLGRPEAIKSTVSNDNTHAHTHKIWWWRLSIIVVIVVRLRMWATFVSAHKIAWMYGVSD